jgi:hypothetical protein
MSHIVLFGSGGWVGVMGSILPFFKSEGFDPEATSAMGAAFDLARRELHDQGQPDLVREVIAKQIIKVFAANAIPTNCALAPWRIWGSLASEGHGPLDIPESLGIRRTAYCPRQGPN